MENQERVTVLFSDGKTDVKKETLKLLTGMYEANKHYKKLGYQMFMEIGKGIEELIKDHIDDLKIHYLIYDMHVSVKENAPSFYIKFSMTNLCYEKNNKI